MRKHNDKHTPNTHKDNTQHKHKPHTQFVIRDIQEQLWFGKSNGALDQTYRQQNTHNGTYIPKHKHTNKHQTQHNI